MKQELTEVELTEKYSNIEDKIPSIWKTYEDAGVNLAQDIAFTWDIRSGELIRVIALMEIRVNGLKVSQHIDSRFAYAGLYPEKMRAFNILPDGIDTEIAEYMLKLLAQTRSKNKE